jgi:hypothetical protein
LYQFHIFPFVEVFFLNENNFSSPDANCESIQKSKIFHNSRICHFHQAERYGAKMCATVPRLAQFSRL